MEKVSTYPCLVCIRMIGDTCKVHGCMHDHYLSEPISPIDWPNTANLWRYLEQLSQKQKQMIGEPIQVKLKPKDNA